ncbi:hypothetical protein EK904_007990 [Melospiza melodia maxima]|nr:hypothetical protein EK904_007990 [Melospiza melodia maxima]
MVLAVLRQSMMAMNSGNVDCPQLYKLSACCPERGTKWAAKEQRDGDGYIAVDLKLT